MKKIQAIIIILFIFNIVPAEASFLDNQVGLGADSHEIRDVFQDGSAVDDPRDTIVDIIKTVLGFLGLFCTILIIWGGFRWMTAGGNEENVRNAKKTIIAASIGLAIILSAYAITLFIANFVFNTLE